MGVQQLIFASGPPSKWTSFEVNELFLKARQSSFIKWLQKMLEDLWDQKKRTIVYTNVISVCSSTSKLCCEKVFQDFDLAHGTCIFSATFSVYKFSYKRSELAGRWLTGMSIYIKCLYKDIVYSWTGKCLTFTFSSLINLAWNMSDKSLLCRVKISKSWPL